METCKNCKWYAEFEGVCCNGDSENRSDFVSEDDSCKEWEGRKYTNAQKIRKMSDDELALFIESLSTRTAFENLEDIKEWLKQEHGNE